MASASNTDDDPPPPPPPPPPHIQSTSSTPNLSSVITAKLTDKNFLHWKQIVEAVIRANRLERFVVGPQIPPRFLTDEDRVHDRVNPAFQAWEAQDQHLFIWLLNSLSDQIHTRVVGCSHAWNRGMNSTVISTLRPRQEACNSDLSSAIWQKVIVQFLNTCFESKLLWTP